MAVSASQLCYTFAWGYLEYLSTDASIYDSLYCSSIIAPAKSNWTSSLGSTSAGSSDILFLGMSGFKILTYLYARLAILSEGDDFPVYSREPNEVCKVHHPGLSWMFSVYGFHDWFSSLCWYEQFTVVEDASRWCHP